MPGFALEPPYCAKAVRYLLLGWPPEDIAREIHCHVATMYRMLANLWMYNAPTKPCLRSKGCPRKLTPFAVELIIEFLSRYPTSSLPELTWFIIWEKRGVRVSTSKLSRMLKRVREDPLDGRGGTGCTMAAFLRGSFTKAACTPNTRSEDATARNEEGMRR